MKTLLQRLQSTLQTNATLSAYVKKVEVVAPRTLPAINVADTPYIGIAPVNSPERWFANQKEVSHIIEVYAVIYLQIEETAILGSAQDKGILDLVTDIDSAVRNNSFASGNVNYLSKPCEITGTEYVTAGYGDNIYLLVATINLECIRLFTI